MQVLKRVVGRSSIYIHIYVYMTEPAAGVLELCLQQAKLAVRLRKELAMLRQSTGSNHMTKRWYTYVILLASPSSSDNPKIYVGSTNNIFSRLLQHREGTAASGTALWVQHNGGMKRVLEIVEDGGDELENWLTMKYMCLFDWKNVRGGTWTKLDLDGPPSALKTFDMNGKQYAGLRRHAVDCISDEVEALWRSSHLAAPPTPPPLKEVEGR